MLRVFDFTGWLDSWKYSGGEVPRQLWPVTIVAGVAGLAAVIVGWLGLGVEPSAWLLAPVLAVGLDLAVTALLDLDASDAFGDATLGYGNGLLLGGALALLAFYIPDPNARRSFAVIAPCLAVASSPLLTRCWAATLFARKMIARADEERERVRAALAGESDALVVRVERIDGAEVELAVIAADQERLLRAEARTIWPHGALWVRAHFLLHEPKLGRFQSADGYRKVAHVSRVEAVKAVTVLGTSPYGLPSSVYAAEVHAGVLVIVLLNAASIAAGLSLMRSSV